jgi:hypothetical protein
VSPAAESPPLRTSVGLPDDAEGDYLRPRGGERPEEMVCPCDGTAMGCRISVSYKRSTKANGSRGRVPLTY